MFVLPLPCYSIWFYQRILLPAAIMFCSVVALLLAWTQFKVWMLLIGVSVCCLWLISFMGKHAMTDTFIEQLFERAKTWFRYGCLRSLFLKYLFEISPAWNHIKSVLSRPQYCVHVIDLMDINYLHVFVMDHDVFLQPVLICKVFFVSILHTLSPFCVISKGNLFPNFLTLYSP